MPTVIIDPGHGGMDPGAVYKGRQEKDDNLRLALAVGELLSQNGVDVLYTRTDDVYDSPYRKAMIANESGADYLISFHRNASPIAGNASGIETLVYADRGVAAQMARDIGFRDIGVIERPGLAVLRRSRMPAVLIETGFIDNDADNLKFDEEFEEIAAAISNGILETLKNEGQLPDSISSASYPPEISNNTQNERPPSPLSDNTPASKLYRVQVGAFKNRNYAFPAFILMDGDLYKVQVGAFSRLENAIRMEYRLRAAGYDTYITT